MADPRPFNLLTSPLEGTNLIEANAGTGKTYAIEAIFLRLLLEKELEARGILVVTFTETATEELRERIRNRIREAMKAFEAAGTSGDSFLDGLVKKHPRPLRAMIILREALRDFDEVPIATIHAFCQRALRENVFESHSLFGTEMTPDVEDLRLEILRDFWRRHFYDAPREFAAFAVADLAGPDAFLELTRRRSLDPALRIVPETPPTAPALDALEPFREAFTHLKSAWTTSREDVAALLMAPGLSRSKYRSPEGLVSALDGYAAAGSGIPIPDTLAKLTPEALRAGTNKGKTTPEHPFFGLCAELLERHAVLEAQMADRLLFLKAEAIRRLPEELAARKRRRNLQSFDDLLLDLHGALERPAGDRLVRRLRTRYNAALIDEFQDTDPVQYAIFHAVFGDGRHPLFLIGDPKQAIYSFRGADLFAYIRASRDVARRYTLTENWRSEPDLVAAVNAFFRNVKNPFLYEKIDFHEATAGDMPDREFLTEDGNREPPLTIRFYGHNRLAAAGVAGNKSGTKALITQALASEISRLIRLGLDGRALIGNRRLGEGDVAVLVRSRFEARDVREALRNSGIPAVIQSDENVFDSGEAGELEQVLAAAAEPGREGYLKAALATEMFGLNGIEIEEEFKEERLWEARAARFREYGEIWDRAGFMPMFRELLRTEGVRERLLSFPDGERRLTNLLHLGELLHGEVSARKLGPPGLMKWLSRQRSEKTRPEGIRAEEQELRLEQDAEAVKIVTIHKSKGLQYPVVFCPFLWTGSRLRKEKTWLYHDPDDDWRPLLVIDPERAGNRKQALREEMAENIRLLYVALTRAKHRCCIAWGPFKDAGTSALARILHLRDHDPEDVCDAAAARLDSLDDKALRGDLLDLAADADGTIAVTEPPDPDRASATPLPPREPPAPVRLRLFTGSIPRDWRVASYSWLTADRADPGSPAAWAPDLPDRDGAAPGVEAAEEPAGIFAFPRGARAGTFFHDLLEHLDFTERDPEIRGRLIEEKLRRHGFGAEWRDAVGETVGKVLAAPFAASGAGIFSEIPMQDRLTELEFHFPLKPLSPGRLAEILDGLADIAPSVPERIGRLRFDPVRGFLKGYMDLVFRAEGRFWLVDWKSNHLGGRVDDYGPERLAEAMEEDLYVLQYHLYVAALDRWLARRVPGYEYETHFGGVCYVFLRGVDPRKGPDYGLYRTRPARETVAALVRGLLE
ncbi:MAG: exodeoxyribonuclease V subunit beta [Syntrophaceae bacterium]|nr:exodeoxyribonuclease V subunit beta [Syntrophaceae bacterium]